MLHHKLPHIEVYVTQVIGVESGNIKRCQIVHGGGLLRIPFLMTGDTGNCRVSFDARHLQQSGISATSVL
jgi:hypothetical protein